MWKRVDSEKPYRVLVVGQTPPPFHGQGIMLHRLVSAHMDSVKICHLRMSFSKSMDQVGRFEVGKVFHLLSIILQIFYRRFRDRAEALYYPPAGPNRVPMYRDMIILICTRWLFGKTIFHMQASGISEMYPKLGWLGQLLFRKAYFKPDALVRLSEHTVDDATGLQAIQEFIIPNSSEDELPRFPGATDKEQGSEPVRLLYLGTVCQPKGILVLLEACANLVRMGGDFQLDIVGSFQPASFREKVESAIIDRKLGSHCRLLGQLTGDEKFTQFARADIFCFPSHYECEAFPCVLVEAMSFGLPVVSTKWRGIQSIVEDEETGFLVPVRDPDAVARAIEQLVSDKEMRLRMGAKAREVFLRRYTTEKHISMMEAMFQAVRFSNPPGRESPTRNPVHGTA